MSKEYLQPCRLSWVRDMLRMKSRTGERFSEHDAVHSLLCDMLTGTSHSYAEYARIWNWPKSTVGDKMGELREQAEAQKRFWNTDEASDGVRTAAGRSSDESGGSEPIKDDSRTALGRRSDGARTHSISESLDNTENDTPPSVARARVKDSDPEPIAVFVEEVGRRPVVPGEYEEIVRAVDNVDVFRKLCRQAYRNVRGDPQRVRLGYLLDDYESAIQKLESDDDNDEASRRRTKNRSHGYERQSS